MQDIEKHELFKLRCSSWVKRLLAEEGVETSTPKDTLRKAFQAGWLTDEAAWLQMLSDRNTTSHIYDEETAKRIYGLFLAKLQAKAADAQAV